jgi:hypothetical protein
VFPFQFEQFQFGVPVSQRTAEPLYIWVAGAQWSLDGRDLLAAADDS